MTYRFSYKISFKLNENLFALKKYSPTFLAHTYSKATAFFSISGSSSDFIFFSWYKPTDSFDYIRSFVPKSSYKPCDL